MSMTKHKCNDCGVMVPRSQKECECGYLFPTRTRARTVRIRVNKTQQRLLNQYAGARRFIWNWAIDEVKKMRRNELRCTSRGLKKSAKVFKYSLGKLGKEFTKLRNSKEYPWLKELNYKVVRSVLADLDKSMGQFFSRCKNKTNRSGFPRHKNKYSNKQIWAPELCRRIDNRTIRVPGIGNIRLTRECNEENIGGAVRLFETAGRWYIKYTINDRPDKKKRVRPDNLVGLDIGIKDYAILSDGTIIENPNLFKKHHKRIQKLNRKLARQKIGSNRRKLTKLRLQKAYASLANRRKHFAHLVSKQISQNYDAICIESHSIKSQVETNKMGSKKAKKRINAAILDAGHAQFRAFLKYKFDDAAKYCVEADKYFASTKICSECGYQLEKLDIKQRSWDCPKCGISHQRDLNAAKNLEKEGRKLIKELEKKKKKGRVKQVTAGGCGKTDVETL